MVTVNPKTQTPRDSVERELQRLREENAALRERMQRKVTLKVSEKGAVSLYGLRRFPVTFYAAEWETLLAAGDSIKAFIEENSEAMSRK